VQSSQIEVSTEGVDPLSTLPVQHSLGAQWTVTDMSGGNGADLGRVMAMLGNVLTGIHGLDRRMARLEHRVGGLEHRMTGLEDRVGELAGQLAAHHGEVVGHGVLISELDTRLCRAEEYLNLPPAA
jgi:hypothetical protein